MKKITFFRLLFALIFHLLMSAATPVAAATTTTTYDDRDSTVWSYTGSWSNVRAARAYKGSYHSSRSINDKAVFTFTGESIGLIYGSSNQMGVMAIYIDGVLVANLNQFSSTVRWQRKWNSSALASGTHSLQLVHLSGGRVNVDAVQVTATDQVNWPTISFQPVVSGLSVPVFATHAGDGSNRLFIVEQSGVIRIFQDGSLLAAPFLDITDRAGYDSNERGLLSLAFPPGYAGKNHFYVFYTDANGALTISRFGLTSTNEADPNSEQIVLSIPHSGSSIHNGGTLAFGPDGYLYFSVGDGNSGGDAANNAQNLDVLFGKILRIDVETGNPSTYTVPANNPFVGVTGRDEIWAYGLRNPWRMSFDRQTGDLYVGDVGQNTWEEIDFQAAGFAGGANYGWRVLEATHCYNPSTGCTAPAAYVPPVVEYSHGSNDSYGCAITGGYVYRGTAYPSMQGIHFSADYCTGRVFGVQNTGGTWHFTELAQPGYSVSSFGEDEAGNLYVVDIGGAIYQVVAP
jgi:glucose/arabinose dehydrogenase